jgi:ankyrin repeat protein
VEKENTELVQILLAADADVNAAAIERYGGTALQEATKRENIELVKILLAAGADVDTISPDERRTAVQMAARSVNIELVQILLKEGADVNICTAGRWHGNAIQEAARSGNM